MLSTGSYWRPARGLAASLWFATTLTAAEAVAAQGGTASSGVRLSVGFSAARPGESIDIPLTLSGTNAPEIGSLTGDISFPKHLLSYLKAELGLASELSQAQIQVAPKDHPSDSRATLLEITVSGKTPIKPGILAYLQFRVATDARNGNYPLKILQATATSPDGEPVPLAKGKEGEVAVMGAAEESPIMGCFFFTH